MISRLANLIGLAAIGLVATAGCQSVADYAHETGCWQCTTGCHLCRKDADLTLWHFQPTSWRPLSSELVGARYGIMVPEPPRSIPAPTPAPALPPPPASSPPPPLPPPPATSARPVERVPNVTIIQRSRLSDFAPPEPGSFQKLPPIPLTDMEPEADADLPALLHVH